MAKIIKFEDIESWKLARSFTKEVYNITATGKFARDFALRDQFVEPRSRFSRTSQKALNVAVTMSFCSSSLSRRDRVVRLALSSTLLLTKDTLKHRNSSHYRIQLAKSAS
jgi:hypothetical protein